MPSPRKHLHARTAARAVAFACALVLACLAAGSALAAGGAVIGANPPTGTTATGAPADPVVSAPAAVPSTTAPVAATPAPAPALAVGTPGPIPSASELDTYLASKGSPLAGQGASFLTSGGRWQVDPRLLVAIAGAESSFGTILCGPFNAWGYGCPNNPYGWTTWAEAIDSVAQGLRTNYVAEGRVSVALIGARYAPVHAANDPTGLNNAWVTNVSRFLIELGGDPQDIDLAGPGSPALPVGAPLGGLGGGLAPSAAFDFEATDDGRAPAGTGAAPAAADVLVAASGHPAHLTIDVRNTGTSAWQPGEVLLERVDTDGHLVGAPYASLGSPVAPQASGSFGIDLAPDGTSDAIVATQWRLVGPTGPFGSPIDRLVHVQLDAVAYEVVSVQAPGAMQPGGHAVVVVRLRNAGSSPWLRDGDAPLRLAVTAKAGPTLATPRWLRDDVPAGILQRTVDPGEVGSVAFPIAMPGDATTLAHLELHAFAGTDLAVGVPIVVDVVPAPAP